MKSNYEIQTNGINYSHLLLLSFQSEKKTSIYLRMWVMDILDFHKNKKSLTVNLTFKI